MGQVIGGRDKVNIGNLIRGKRQRERERGIDRAWLAGSSDGWGRK